MRISERSRALLIEVSVAGLGLVIVSWLLWPGDLGLRAAAFHPAWILVLVLAARYGPGGFLASLGLVVVPLAAVSALSVGETALVQQRVAHGADAVPLLCGAALAWVAWGQRRTTSRLNASLQRLARERRRERDWNEAQEHSLAYLRARCDRMDASITLWKNISDSVERGQLARSATATLELAMIRTRATSGRVERMDGADPTLIASLGACEDYKEAADDATALSALATGWSQRAGDVDAAEPGDCDVCIPIVDSEAGVSVGAIRLWGADPARLGASELGDLEAMGQWFAPVLARSDRGPRIVRACSGGT